MPTQVERSSLLNTAHFGYLLDAFVYSVVATDVEKIIAYSVWLISLDNLHRNSINLIWNGTPVFCRFDTIQGEPPNIEIFSVVRFLISMNDIPVQQPYTNKSLANSKSGLFNSIVVKACNSSSVRRPLSLWSESTLYWANGLRAILPL